MNLLKSFRMALVASYAIVAASVGFAQTQPWPTRTVRLVVSFPAGGGTDGAARLFAERFSAVIGQPVVVENRAGASGTIGAMSVVRAEPDGYTLLFCGESEMSIAPVTMKDLPYNPLVDLIPIALIGVVPYILVANAQFPPNTVAELVAYAKQNPGKVNYSSFGKNSSNHLAGEEFRLATGIDVVHVPYKGSAPSIADLLGGRVQYTFDTPASTFQHIKAGKLKAIATGTPERLPSAPNLPTMSEAGLPGFLSGTYWGLLAPAKTPKEIVDRIYAATVTTLQSPQLQAAYRERDITPAKVTSPDQFREFIARELDKWRKLVASGSITPE
jgi:tripartite-type tricarboxylate transporter receptor subunit TctC